MKKFTKTALCIAGVTFVLGIGTCVAGLTVGANSGFEWGKDSELITLADETDMAEFTDIDVAFGFGDVRIETGNSYGLKIIVNETYDKKVQTEWSNDGGTLSVRSQSNDHNWNMFDGWDWINLEGITWLGNAIVGNNYNDNKQGVVITIPRGVDMNDVSLFTDSGTAKIGELTARSIAMNSSLGSVYLANANAQDIDLNSDSGSVKCESISGDSIKAATDLGSVKATDVNVTDAAIFTSMSGSVECDSITAGSITATTDLGRVDVINITATDGDFSSMSGSVELDDVTLTKADVVSDLGSIRMNNVSADTMKIDNASGSITCDNITANAIDGNADLGSVNIDESNVVDMVFDVDSGSFNYDGKLTSCNVTAGLGTVRMDIAGNRDDYSIKGKTELGSIYINGDKFGQMMNDGITSKPLLDFEVSSGSLHLDFD